MKYLPLMFLVACATCAHAPPTEQSKPSDQDHDIVWNPSVPSAPAEAAIAVALAVYNSHYGTDFYVRPDIRWVTTSCDGAATDEPSIEHHGQCYFGVMWSCDHLYVAGPPSGEACDTSLAHELAHCYENAGLRRKGSYNHRDPELWGRRRATLLRGYRYRWSDSVVTRANLAICRMERGARGEAQAF